METMIQIFKSEVFGEIRTMTNEKGETFFVGKDVAEALGYNNPLKAIRDHVDNEDKGLNESFTPGGKQKVVIINESGHHPRVLYHDGLRGRPAVSGRCDFRGYACGKSEQ